MSALYIPAASVEELQTHSDDMYPGRSVDADDVREIAAPVVVAELRRLADEARKAAEAWGERAKQCNPGTPAWESAVVTAEKRWFLTSHLEMRAAELDGGPR